ncbi:MAG: ubiquitin carboxyl-terminal hydrolase [Chthoniobacterales bacterium]
MNGVTSSTAGTSIDITPVTTGNQPASLSSPSHSSSAISQKVRFAGDSLEQVKTDPRVLELYKKQQEFIKKQYGHYTDDLAEQYATQESKATYEADMLKEMGETGNKKGWSTTELATQEPAELLKFFSKNPLPIEEQGISNSGVDCYLNSALQSSRDLFHTAFRNKQEQQVALAALKKKSPYGSNSPLAAFLEGKFDARDPQAAGLLRREVRQLIEATGDGQEISENINPTGNSRAQCDAEQALRLLNDIIGIPETMIEEASDVQGRDKETKEIKEGIIPLEIQSQRPSPLESLVTASWNDDTMKLRDEFTNEQLSVQKAWSLKNPPLSLTFQIKRFGCVKLPHEEGGVYLKHREDHDDVNLKGKDNVEAGAFHPAYLDKSGRPMAVKLNTPITGITEPVNVPTKGSTEQTKYTPSSIICHYGEGLANSGHYVTYLKKGNNWYLKNDKKVTKCNDLHALSPFGASGRNGKNLTHLEFLERNAYVINYQRAD